MAKITSAEARLSIYQRLAPLIADLSEQLGYVVPIYWPALDYAQEPDRTLVYVNVLENSVTKESEGVEAVSGSDSTEQIRVEIFLTEERTDFSACTQSANDIVKSFSRGRQWFDVAADKSVVLYPCQLDPVEVRDGRRLIPIIITFNYETY